MTCIWIFYLANANCIFFTLSSSFSEERSSLMLSTFIGKQNGVYLSGNVIMIFDLWILFSISRNLDSSICCAKTSLYDCLNNKLCGSYSLNTLNNKEADACKCRAFLRSPGIPWNINPPIVAISRNFRFAISVLFTLRCMSSNKFSSVNNSDTFASSSGIG